MDGDTRTRFRRAQPNAEQEGESWGYSATIPAEIAHPQAGTAKSGPSALKQEPDDDKKTDDKAKDEDKSEDGDADKGKAKKQPMSRGKKILYAFIGLCVLATLITVGVLYWLHARHYENTDDAFIDGYISQVSAQVAGKVIALDVRDNDEVKAGQVLLQIEPRDYQVKLDSAKAQRAQAVAQVEQAKAGLTQRQADVDQAQAQVRVAEADLGQQQSDLTRFRAVDPKAISKQQLDTTSAQTKSAAARLDATRKAVAGARAQMVAQNAMIEAAAANVEAADATIANAALQLGYTRVIAPQDGKITKRTVDLGNYANVGQSLMAVVPDQVWVTANFKETQLVLMQVGQAVLITVDACPKGDFEGHVQSFQSGTGSVFSSLPAENATGNYVKVVQRVPVKIVFDKQPEGCRLAPGMSVEPRVTVRP